MNSSSPFARWSATLGLLCWSVFIAGCGDKSGVGKVVPVAGKVTVAAQPLTAGTVTFVPDAAKGNNSKFQPFGMLDKDGKYKLHTEGKEGAPPGWYKVTISTMVPPGSDVPAPSKGGENKTAGPTVSIDPKYTTAETTPISLEVKDDPQAGDYDIKLIK
jgi:hypothetical protein